MLAVPDGHLPLRIDKLLGRSPRSSHESPIPMCAGAGVRGGASGAGRPPAAAH